MPSRLSYYIYTIAGIQAVLTHEEFKLLGGDYILYMDEEGKGKK
jgi:hypothetical protein